MQDFKSEGVVPDVIDVEPEKSATIKYTKTQKEVSMGNELAPKDVVEMPQVTYDAEAESFYTIIMTDPDAPSRKDPKNREFIHWLVVNIKGGDVSKGKALAEYVGSGPPKDTGLHRYVFLVYKQPGNVEFDEHVIPKTDGKSRGKFSTKQFVTKHKLNNPIAGNFYVAQYDDSVPALHKQLGF